MLSELKMRHNDHERFEKLIALYSTGELTDDEVHLLACHLHDCELCQEDLAQYRMAFRTLGPTAFFNQSSIESFAGDLSWAPEAKRRLLKSFEASKGGKSFRFVAVPNGKNPGFSYSNAIASSFWKAASLVLLLIVLGAGALITTQSVVRNKQTDLSNAGTIHDRLPETDRSSRAKIAALTSDRDNLKLQLANRSAVAESLAHRISEQQAEITDLKSRMEQLANERNGAVAGREQTQIDNATLQRDQENLTHQLQDLELSLTQTQQKLRDSQSQHVADLGESSRLQSQLAGLEAELRDREATIKQQQTLLASDRDIRDLMGARELTIAEISDFDLNAQKKKPFGRVFFTKNKSLIFYAFDLDKQKGLHSASAFQAWGVRDSDRKTAVNLGILYKDSEANRRWTLKFDDPEILKRIDAVFVTVEPNGGSIKPSGKQLLYAYIRTQPNHP